MPSLYGLWIGLDKRDEFRPVRDWLTQSALILDTVPTVAEVPRASVPDMIIIGESWPDEFTANDVSELLTIAPLARTVCITGAWSEAVGRTRSHWPAAWRVPLWDAIPRLERELFALAACRTGASAVAVDFPPATASRQETWQWQQGNASSLPTDPVSGLRVDLREIADPAYAAWLMQQLRSAGHTVATEAADVVLFDVEPWSPTMAANVRDAIGRSPHVIPVALTGWSTPELRRELQSLGIVHIADKLSPHSLIRLIQHILPGCDRF